MERDLGGPMRRTPYLIHSNDELSFWKLTLLTTISSTS